MSLKDINDDLKTITGRNKTISQNIASLVGDMRASYAVAEEKGAEIPSEKNLENLIGSVNSIDPDPGWVDPDTEYGGFFYYDDWETVYTANTDQTHGCVVSSIDSAKFKAYAEAHELENMNGYRFSYMQNWQDPEQSYAWNTYTSQGELWLTTEEMLTEAGINVTPTEEWADLQLDESIQATHSAQTRFYEIQNEGDIQHLYCQPDEYSNYSYKWEITINDFTIPAAVVRRFVFGRNWEMVMPGETGQGYINQMFLAYSGIESISADTHGLIGTISGGFLACCENFNSDISFPEVTQIQHVNSNGLYGFLDRCHNFNGNISLPKVTYVGWGFLEQCTSFNQPLILPLITELPVAFLCQCKTFNSQLVLGTITAIGNTAFYMCEQFNQPIDFSTVRTIGGNMLSYCYAFNQDIILTSAQSWTPATITRTEDTFLEYARSFTSVIDFGNLKANQFTRQSGCGADRLNTSACYTVGVKVKGANINTIFNGINSPFKNGLDGSYYRNWTVIS